VGLQVISKYDQIYDYLVAR